MDEERLKRILDIEMQGEMLYDRAVRETNLLPIQAEEQARLLVEQSRQEAETEAQKLMESLCDPEHIKKVLDQNMQKIQQREALAAANMTKAVNFVLQSLLRKNNNQ